MNFFIKHLAAVIGALMSTKLGSDFSVYYLFVVCLKYVLILIFLNRLFSEKGSVYTRGWSCLLIVYFFLLVALSQFFRFPLFEGWWRANIFSIVLVLVALIRFNLRCRNCEGSIFCSTFPPDRCWKNSTENGIQHKPYFYFEAIYIQRKCAECGQER